MCYASLAISISRHRSIVSTGRGGALPRASDTNVSVRPGEAVAVTQERPVIATVSDRARMPRSGQGHAERRIGAAGMGMAWIAMWAQITHYWAPVRTSESAAVSVFTTPVIRAPT